MELARRSGVGALRVAVVVADLPAQRDGRTDGGLRHRVGRVARGVPHGDTQLGRGREVDVVRAGRRHADQPQAGQPLQRRAVEYDLVGDDDVRLAAAVQNLCGVGRLVTSVGAQCPDGGEVGAAEAVLVQKNDVRSHGVLFFVCFSIRCPARSDGTCLRDRRFVARAGRSLRAYACSSSPSRSRTTTEAQPMPNRAGM